MVCEMARRVAIPRLPASQISTRPWGPTSCQVSKSCPPNSGMSILFTHCFSSLPRSEGKRISRTPTKSLPSCLKGERNVIGNLRGKAH